MKELYTAILNVQQGAPVIDKSANNPFFKSKYADLPSIWLAVKDLMKDNGIFVINYTVSEDLGDFIVTKIIHAETSQEIQSKTKIILKEYDAQKYGSYITYMRRYALSAMLGLVTDKDDDANVASQTKEKNSNPVKKIEKPEPIKKTWEQIRANEIGLAIKKHTDISALEKMWVANEKDLEKINLVSEVAFNALEKSYKAKKFELDQIPE